MCKTIDKEQTKKILKGLLTPDKPICSFIVSNEFRGKNLCAMSRP